MIRRTSAHLSDRAKVPVDFWFCHIDNDHAKDQTMQWSSQEYFFNLRVNTKIVTRVSTNVPRVDDVCIYRQKEGEGSCVQ